MCDECERRAIDGLSITVQCMKNRSKGVLHCLTGPVNWTHIYIRGHLYWVDDEGFDTQEDHAEAAVRYMIKKGLGHGTQG